MASGLFESHILHLIFAVFDLIYAFVCKQVKLILNQSLMGYFAYLLHSMKKIRQLLLFLAVLSCSCGYAQIPDHLLCTLQAAGGTATRLTYSSIRDILHSE